MGHGHLHHHQQQKRDPEDQVDEIVNEFGQSPEKKVQRAETYVKTVYQTLTPDFTGEIGGYSTQGQDKSLTTQDAASPTQDQETTPTEDTQATETEAPDSITAPTATSLDPTLNIAKPTSSLTVHENHASSLSTLPTATSSPAVAIPSSSKDEVSNGPSAGAKAGIAFGVLGGVLLVSLMVFFLFKRHKRQVQRQTLEDGSEKLHGGLGSDNLARMPSRSGPNAPRISLRPVTQFLPNWNLDKNMQKGTAVNLAPASSNQWDRPGTSQSNHPNNPFGSGAERINPPTGPDGIVQNSLAQDPWTANGPAITVAAAATGAVGIASAAGAAPLARKTSIRKDGQRNYDLTVPAALDAVPPSPVGTEFSISSMPAGAPNPQSSGAAAIAAAGGPSSSTVHRVQLDFKPTLEDEMELRAGDLVRLLHEYDDGWALCIRLDRSKQGVVPRTCLSTRPVKPRPPQGAPRPGPPINPQGGFPRGPNQPGRPMTPQGRPMTPQGRPMTPQGQYQPQGTGPWNGPPAGAPPGSRPRPQSPGPSYQSSPDDRPQSPNGMGTRPRAPSGPSPMNPTPQPPNQAPQRKLVPGQAY